MIFKELEVVKQDGLKNKDAETIVQRMMRYDSEIFFEWKNKKINAKSLMGVISMGLSYGDKLMAVIKGDDQDAAADDVVFLFSKSFKV